MAAGRRTRTIPAGLRRALRARDGGCAFPGCTNSRFTDAHHIDHWADGGDTSLDNLVQLCRRHHTLIHEGGFAVGRDDHGGLEFRRPGGGVLQPLPDKLRSHPEAFRGLTDPGTAPRPASGDPLDLDLTVGCMLERRERALAGAR